MEHITEDNRNDKILQGCLRERRCMKILLTGGLGYLSVIWGFRKTFHILYGLPVTCLRPFNIFSPPQKMENKKAAGEVFNIATGKPTKIFIRAGIEVMYE